MIAVFFPGGAFGSTLEYCIRRFSKEFETIATEILPDGSMHGYYKEFHPLSIDEFKNIGNDIDIVTPVYPNLSLLTVDETVDEFIKLVKCSKVIFITLDDVKMVERNWLFAYYKIGLYKGFSLAAEFKKWNQSYLSFDDMARWEQREWLSFTINYSTSKFTTIKNKAQDNWLLINTENILYDFRQTLKKIFNYLELTLNDDGLDQFIVRWTEKQQYIIDELNLINKIIEKFCKRELFVWNNLSIMGEAIIQSKLSKIGYELKCYNLNIFPTNTDELLNASRSA
jgi:hypothetical protein